jgi:hypothetical protein
MPMPNNTASMDNVINSSIKVNPLQTLVLKQEFIAPTLHPMYLISLFPSRRIEVAEWYQ